MGDCETRRVVVWVDHSSDSVVTMRWAAQHAEARRLPLHVVRYAGISDVVPGRGELGSGLDGRDLAAEAALSMTYTVRRVLGRHQDLAVTVQIVEDGRIRPGFDVLSRGDILVTGPTGYIDLAEHAPVADVPRAVRVPLVVVPAGTPAASGVDRRVVLLAGARPSELTADFAFETADGLRARVDVVRVAAQLAVSGPDRWTGTADACLHSERRLQSVLESIGERYRGVEWSTSVLSCAPRRVFRAVTRGAQLTLLPDPTEPGEDVRSLLAVAASPLALVPARVRAYRDEIVRR